MKNINKILCVLMAAVLCLLAVGCGKDAVTTELPDENDNIISSDDFEVLAYEALMDFTDPANKKLSFGAYLDQPLEWTVVNVDGEGVATLLCDTVIEYKQFNSFRGFDEVRGSDTDNLYDELNVMNWEESSVRAWLNSTEGFLAEFTADDLAKIYAEELSTIANPVTDRGECTTDSDLVFLLSADEAKEWFATAEERVATATQNAVSNGVRVASNGNSPWWLRSMGESMWHASCVNADGSINYSGMGVEIGRAGVRPCIRLVSTVPGGEQPVDISKALWGNVVNFGTYEQDGDDASTEDILWRVIAVSGTKRLLVSADVLDYAKFNAEIDGSKWADSDLRAWLNGEFYNGAFTSAEQAAIVEVTNSTADNADYVVDSGDDSADKVFILSKEEVENYFYNNDYGWELAKASTYSQNREVLTSDGSAVSIYEHGVQVDPGYGTCGYWLRNAGQNDISAMYVYYYGEVNTEGSLVRNTFLGVRPCIWVDTALVGE